MLELTLVSRDQCHLCEEMERMLVGELRHYPHRFRRLEVGAEPGLEELYGTEVPVLLINGRKAFKYRCTPVQLRRALARAARLLP
ncbi:MAG TPA: glutaredoxin family protein [Candidatus Binataceae bacterium]|nr:glutaredoxin family protein [Candidatus Binataceae bacterium]